MVRLATAFPFSSGHVQTLFPPVFRPRPEVSYERQRLDTSDGDFVDLDWSRGGGERLVVILHGLEGHSVSKYVLGMARAARLHGLDVLAMNHRSCGGELNRKPTMYHSGWTDDLHEVLVMVEALGRYRSVDLVGFSLGGNLILKYLGESPQDVEPSIAAAVAISAPVDLAVCSRQLDRPTNWIYNRRFLAKLDRKIREMASLHPGAIDTEPLTRVASITDFDDLYTAPMHGFTDAADLYKQCSARQFLDAITTPSLLISALNDPFLGPSCYPVEEAERSSCFHLETPAHGGHVGFHAPGPLYWSEQRAVAFVDGVLARR